ncbi:MAG: tetratricopeptide repeat protein, partial [Candidatus Binatia bacterium]
SVNPEARQRAAALLQSPQYNLLTPFQDARSERQLQSVKYVLLGENFLRKNLLFAAGAMAAAGPGAVATLGMANAVMVGTNFYQVMTNNPVSAQPVIDAGVAYVRSHPNSENAAEIYRVLADAFEERGLYAKAISYHELAGSLKERITALEDKSAKALLNAASKSDTRGAREYYLTSVIDQHPDTPAAAEATKKLADLAKEENQGLRMSKQFLLEHPELYGPRGLGLKASLFDGKPQNMELADRGVNLINDDEMLVYYQTPWGVRSQTYPVPKIVTERFYVTLREKNLQVAMADVNQRAKDSVGGIKNLPGAIARAEHERRGAAGEERAEFNDTTFTLIREAGPSASYPRVLDAQMLSDNERDPGSKYKLPPISGSISASRFSMTGALPTGLWGNQLAIGGDHRSPFAGVQLPIPLLQGFIPVDFMVQGRPGGISLYPKIRTGADSGADPELYR